MGCLLAEGKAGVALFPESLPCWLARGFGDKLGVAAGRRDSAASVGGWLGDLGSQVSSGPASRRHCPASPRPRSPQEADGLAPAPPDPSWQPWHLTIYLQTPGSPG